MDQERQLDGLIIRPRLTWLFGGFCLLLTAVIYVYQFRTPSDGARIDKSPQAWTSQGIYLRAYTNRSGLRDDDLLVAVNGEPVLSITERLFQPGAVPIEWKTGQIVTYQIIRDGQNQEISIPLEKQSLSAILRAHWGILLYAVVTQVLGIFVFLRRPRDPTAAAIFILAMTSSHFYVWALYRQIPDLLNGYGFWLYSMVSSFLWLSNWAAGVHLALTFPRPRPAILKHPHWLYFPYLAAFLFYLIFVAVSRRFNSNTLEWINAWGQGESLAAILMFLPMVSIFVHQYRTDRAESSRKKIRLVVFSALAGGSLTVLFYLLPPFFAVPSLDPNFVGVILLLIPLSMVVAILRYQLFDIDVIIRRTLIYSSLTFCLALIYFSSVVAIQQVFRSITGQSGESQAAIVISTLVIAALFNPFRRRIQEFIDRRFYRRNYNAQNTLEAFAGVLRDEVDIGTLTGHMLAVIEETVQPETLSIWLVKVK